MYTRKELFIILQNWKYEKWSTYCNDLRGSYSHVRELLYGLKEEEQPEGWDNILKKVKETQDQIMESSTLYYQGLPSLAYMKIKEVMDSINLPIITIPRGSVFYRMRIIKSEDMRGTSHHNMFHIPLYKRNLVQTERFSAPGYPCLYLGYSSYVCWEEMNRPPLDSCMVSKLSTQNDIKVLNLSFTNFEEWNDHFENRVISDSLIIASMIKRSSPDDKFKDEYSIPQGIMEWVINHNYELSNSNQDEPDYIYGIRYVSVHKNDQFEFPRTIFENLAIPVIDSTSEGYCRVLAKQFHISKPTCTEWEQIRRNPLEDVIDAGSYDEQDEEVIREGNYKSSLFGLIEKRLDSFELYGVLDMMLLPRRTED